MVASRARAGDDLVDRVHGIDELSDLLPQHDVVIVITPLNASTHHLVDDAFLSAMPDGALLVNVARGPVAATEALVRHSGLLRLASTSPTRALADRHPLAAPRCAHHAARGRNTTALLPVDGAPARSLTRVVGGEEPLHLVRPIVT